MMNSVFSEQSQYQKAVSKCHISQSAREGKVMSVSPAHQLTDMPAQGFSCVGTKAQSNPNKSVIVTKGALEAWHFLHSPISLQLESPAFLPASSVLRL